MTAGTKVVVVGSGAAALAAALSAAVAGAEVTVLEAAEYIGGTSGISGGVAWVPANHVMEAAGTHDTPEAALEYLHAIGLGDTNAVAAEAYVRNGARVIRAIEENSTLRWQQMLFPDYTAEFPGSNTVGRGVEIFPVAAGEALTRMRPDPYGARRGTMAEMADGHPTPDELEQRERDGIEVGGRGLVAGLYLALVARGGTVHTGARATRLIGSIDGVTGVEADGTVYPGNVVIASGGFERNEGLARTFLRAPLLAPAGPPTNQGDGLLMGMSVGAALGNMSEAWWCPAMAVPGGSLDGAPLYAMLFSDCGMPGGVLVDARGRRFTDEAADYSSVGRAAAVFDAATYSFPAVASWLVFDARRRAERGFADEETWSLSPGSNYRGPSTLEPDPSWLVRGDSLEELADRTGLPSQALVETIDRFNGHAARGVDADFGRGSTIFDRFVVNASSGRPVAGGDDSPPKEPLRAITEPPFYAVRILLGCLGTKGGLRIDGQARVLRADGGGVINGLHAAGNASANPFGHAYPGPGSTIGPGLIFGWLAGESAAAA
jgi:3-oxosteroid 1-dehydrogenase